MKTSLSPITFFAAALLALPSLAQEMATTPPKGTASQPGPTAAPASPAGSPGQMSKADVEKMMQQMVELGKPNKNHKLLADLAGTWDVTVKLWMGGDSSKKPDESKGTATRRAIMDGRFLVSDVSWKMEMPGPDGKKKQMDFKSMTIEGYDKIKNKFVSTWLDNMATVILMLEGTYDPAGKTITYNGECDMMPGVHVKFREVVKIGDQDHHTMEWYDDGAGREVKMIQIDYVRKK